MKTKSMSRPLFPPLFFLMLLFFLLLSMGSLQKSREDLAGRIAPSILRFHILANSDSKEDQAVKLEVRSYLLDWICDRLPETVNSKESMVSWLEENQSGLESAAGHFLMQKGISYQAHLSLERTYFPTRVYDDLVIPCGTYDAARVILGKGKGHNWWCVVFPTLCTAASLDEFESAAASGGFTDDELRLITGAEEGYVLKFKTLEWLEKLKALFD